MGSKLTNHLFFSLRKRMPQVRFNYAERLTCPLVQDRLPEDILSKLDEKGARLSLFYAWVLDQIPLEGPIHSALDLGSRDFTYATGLVAALKDHGLKELTALEVDPFPYYWNFYRRGDVGRYHANLASQLGPQVDYCEGDWLKQPKKKYNLMTVFFPFLFADLNEDFGLPTSAFNPAEMYKKCFDSSDQVLFFHQGKEEAEESARIIFGQNRGSIVYQNIIHQNPWMIRKHPVHLLLWKKTPVF